MITRKLITAEIIHQQLTDIISNGNH